MTKKGTGGNGSADGKLTNGANSFDVKRMQRSRVNKFGK